MRCSTMENRNKAFFMFRKETDSMTKGGNLEEDKNKNHSLSRKWVPSSKRKPFLFKEIVGNVQNFSESHVPGKVAGKTVQPSYSDHQIRVGKTLAA